MVESKFTLEEVRTKLCRKRHEWDGGQILNAFSKTKSKRNEQKVMGEGNEYEKQ